MVIRHHYSLAKSLITTLSFVMLLCGSVVDSSAEDNVLFRWAFGGLVGKDKKLVSVRRDTTLETGDELKMMVDVRKPCFVYLIYKSSQDKLQKLFPSSVLQDNDGTLPPVTYHIPEATAWFTLDYRVGEEKFYLLASGKPLTELERLLGEHRSAKPGEKGAAREKVIKQIRHLRRQNRNRKAAAERPVSIAGNVRSITPDLSRVEISAEEFYAKSFTIDHK